ncbi:MAG: ATPase, partial [Bacillota bacterium]|nr:ATPase [Bacillota bacterium]
EELLRGQLVVMLAGGVAEEMFEGSRSTGTQGDYQQAIQVALKMISAGMSELGIVDERLVPKSALHAIVQGIMAEAEAKAKAVLIEYQEKIHEVLMVLLEQEKMSGDEIRTLMAG